MECFLQIFVCGFHNIIHSQLASISLIYLRSSRIKSMSICGPRARRSPITYKEAFLMHDAAHGGVEAVTLLLDSAKSGKWITWILN